MENEVDWDQFSAWFNSRNGFMPMQGDSRAKDLFAAWNAGRATHSSPLTAEQIEAIARDIQVNVIERTGVLGKCQSLKRHLELMAVAIVPSEWECRLCLKGFPSKDGVHYGTQSLGMIPAALCENASPEEIGEWIAEQDDNGLSSADLVQGIACAIEHAERRATATKYLAVPPTASSSPGLARRIAEKIVDFNANRFANNETAIDYATTIIESELATTPQPDAIKIAEQVVEDVCEDLNTQPVESVRAVKSELIEAIAGVVPVETGTWMKDIPRKGDWYVNGYYWERQLSNYALRIVEINQHGYIWYGGTPTTKYVRDLRATGDVEWQGPIAGPLPFTLLARSVEDQREIESLKKQLGNIEERDASICPEDVGVVELVGHLRAELGAAKKWHDEVAVVAKHIAFEHGGTVCEPKAIGDFLCQLWRDFISRNQRISELEALTTCGCGDVFNERFRGICPNCVAALEAARQREDEGK